MARRRLADRARGGSGNSEREAVRVWLMGGFSVSVGGRGVEEDAWRRRKAAGVVKILALARGHRMHRERILALLWPDLDAKAQANNLHRALHFARNALGDRRLIEVSEDFVSLCPDGNIRVDVEAFEEAANIARRTREPAAYRRAVELYTGELLPEDRYEEWVEERRRELKTMRIALLSELAALHEERGEFDAAIEALHKVAESERADEGANVALMRLHAAAGRKQKALLQYERLSKALSEELGAKPGAEADRLFEEIREGRIPSVRTRSGGGAEGGSKHNLPNAYSSFVGRNREVVEVRRSLAMARLLTLTGAGGSGKTRLALEAAKDLVGAHPDGVWMVELAPLSDATLAPQAVAAALGVREQPGRALTETLADHLRGRNLLLILDNCEHLVEEAARLADALLRACKHLHILATSREPLGIPGEAIWPVPPLSLPDGESAVGEMMASEAVRLFVERARSRLPDFELGEKNAGAVGRVCRRLDGIPLAIELATARMGALAVEQVAERLEDSLKLLSARSRRAEPRHRTMRATLAWSHDLLEHSERVLFRRLSVFAGGWTLAAAEDVCSGLEEDDVLDLLSRLVEKSLVDASAEGGMRYRMLEPVRQYGWEKLEESGEMERVRERHAQYYLALAERVEFELNGARPMAWLEMLESEYDNLRAALSWALDSDEAGERAEVGLRLAAALGRFWDTHGPGEGRRWLEKGLAESGSPPASVRAKALNEAGFIAVYEGDPAGTALLEEALALYKESGDKAGAARVIGNLGHAMVHVAGRERIASLSEEVETMLAESSEKMVSAHLLMYLGLAAASVYDFEEMEVRLEEALALFRDLEDVRNISTSLLCLGYVFIGRDDPAGAARFEESLIIQRDLKHKTAIFMGILGMSGVAALRGQPLRSAKLMGASEALREKIGLTLSSSSKDRYDYDKYLAPVRGTLGEAGFDAAFSEGWAMSSEEAVEYALGPEDTAAGVDSKPSHPPKPAPAPHTVASPLTPRQREVAVLVGRGLSNREIAAELHLSEHTVITHVREIRKKLGVHSRARIAAKLRPFEAERK